MLWIGAIGFWPKLARKNHVFCFNSYGPRYWSYAYSVGNYVCLHNISAKIRDPCWAQMLLFFEKERVIEVISTKLR